MSAALRRGACPTLAAPMATGDGLLARLRPAAPALSPQALAGLCRLAVRHGNGIVEITARGNLQIRGLTTDSAGLFAADVDALGIEVATSPLVTTGPLAGVDPLETADPGPLAAAIRQALATTVDPNILGPKVCVIVDGGGVFGCDEITADVRATPEQAAVGMAWRLSIPGADGIARSFGGLDEKKAAGLVVAVIAEIARLGRQARGRTVSDEALRSLAGRSIEPPPVKPDGPAATPASAGLALALTDGRTALACALPFGQIEAERLRAFIEDAQRAGVKEFRLAPRRMLLAISANDHSGAIKDAAASAGLIIRADDPRLRVVACPGSPACGSGHLGARQIASEIAAMIAETVSIHVSGCPKRCAAPVHAGLTLLGMPDAAELVIDGARNISIGRVAKPDAATAASQVLALVAREKRPGESEAACLTRLGAARLAGTFERKDQ